MHPLGQLLTDALDGRFPPADGGWHRVPPWSTQVEGIVAFTGHAVLAIHPGRPDAELAGVDGYGGAHHPSVVLRLAGANGWIDSIDAVLARRAPGGPAQLVARPDRHDHPRVRFARAARSGVRVYGPAEESECSVATVGTGIGGLTEISVELANPGRGGGARFVRAALSMVAPGTVTVAAVAPGNTASLRAFLRAGFTPLASVQLFRPSGPGSSPAP